jgi:WD40 repeat protein
MKSTIYDLNMKLNEESTNEYFSITSKNVVSNLNTNVSTQGSMVGSNVGSNISSNNNGESPSSVNNLPLYSNEKEIFKPQFQLKGHTASVHQCKFSSIGQFLSSCSFDKTIRVWNIDHQEEVLTLNGHEFGVLDLDWSMKDTFIVSGGIDKTIKVWDLKKEQCIHSFDSLSGGFIQCNLISTNHLPRC